MPKATAVPMHALAPSSNNSSSKQVTLNVLPCHINHNGPVKNARRYWAPYDTPAPASTTAPAQDDTEDTTNPTTASTDDAPRRTRTSHFRGRRLLAASQALALPPSYTGIALRADPHAKLPARDNTLKRTLMADLEAQRTSGALDAAAYHEEEAALREEAARGELDGPELKGVADAMRFEGVVSWGWDCVLDGEDGEDGGVQRGLGEWIAVAGAVHGFE